MVEVFFKLVDTIIELLKQKQQSKTQVFKEIIEPLFNDMTLVVQDYFSLFLEAEESYFEWRSKRNTKAEDSFLSDTSEVELRNLVNKIKKRREEFLHARIKIREMANLIQQEFNDKLITDFAHKILRFFYSSEIIPEKPWPTSDSHKLVDLFELLGDSELSEPELRMLKYNLRNARGNFERSWSAITGTYAMLRIEYLGPQKIGIKRSKIRRTKRAPD